MVWALVEPEYFPPPYKVRSYLTLTALLRFQELQKTSKNGSRRDIAICVSNYLLIWNMQKTSTFFLKMLFQIDYDENKAFGQTLLWRQGNSMGVDACPVPEG